MAGVVGTSSWLFSCGVSLVEQAYLAVSQHDVKEPQMGDAAIEHPGGLIIRAPTHVDGVAQVNGGTASNLHGMLYLFEPQYLLIIATVKMFADCAQLPKQH